MPHVITISTEQRTFQAYDVATHGDLRAVSAKSCAARKLVRMMIEAGAEDGPVEARGLDGRLRYTVRSLHAFAKYALTENPRPRLIRWTPYPNAAKAQTAELQDAD
jgi:hypothetical protein